MQNIDDVNIEVPLKIKAPNPSLPISYFSQSSFNFTEYAASAAQEFKGLRNSARVSCSLKYVKGNEETFELI